MLDFVQLGANVGDDETDVVWPLLRGVPADTSKEHGATTPPASTDPAFVPIHRPDWKGIFVEPMPQCFEKLKKNYADMSGHFFENAAITDFDGETTIYYVREDITEMASLNKDHRHDWTWENRIKVTVKCMTLETLLEKHGLLHKQFELLTMDVERTEGKIILSTDFSIVLPKQIRYEHVHLAGVVKHDINNHLSGFGYKKIDDPYFVLKRCSEGQYDTVFEKRF